MRFCGTIFETSSLAFPYRQPSSQASVTCLSLTLFLSVFLDTSPDSSKLQEENPGFRSAEGIDSLVPCLAMMAVKFLWKLGSHQASTPRRDLSLPFLWLISSPTQSSWEGRQRLLPRPACEEMDSSLPLGKRSKNKLPSAQHFLWHSGDNLAMLEPARGDLGQDRSKAVRTMDEFGQLVTFTGRALLGNQGEAQKVTCQSACSGWEGTLPWKGVTGKVTYAVLPSPK